MSNSAPTPYVGRFAPSPSGPLHFGSLVTALGSYLQAKSQHGQWRLRIEDLDPLREVAGAADDILTTLDKLGLHWDGAVVYQSQRLEVYQAVLEQWARSGLTYYCHCSRKQIATRGPYYDGHCRHLNLPATHSATRLIVKQPIYHFQDRLQGTIAIPAGLAEEDFIVRRRDGFYAYNLAVVIDDAAAGITEVVRGADLLQPTARQIALYQQLDAPVPHWLHLPLVCNDGKKLSKHLNAPAIPADCPSQLLWRALTFLGQQPPNSMFKAPPRELLAWARLHWCLDKVPHSTNITL